MLAVGAHLQQSVDQPESHLGPVAREHDSGGQVARALVQAQRRPDPAEEEDAEAHRQPADRTAGPVAAEVRAGPCQADISPATGHAPAGARTHDALGIWAQRLALSVAGAIIPPAQEGADHGADA